MKVMSKQEEIERQFDRVAEGYDFMESVFHNNDFFLSWMPNRRGRALDIGCGSGITAFALASHFEEIVGIDISETMLDIAKHRRALPNIQYKKMDATRLPDGETYDYIISRTTFHHIKDIPSILGHLQNMLEIGGRIAILDCAWRKNVKASVWNRVFPWMELLRNIVHLGPLAAWKIFRFRLSKPWLDHLAADHYMTENEFREVYARSLPGCETGWHGCFMYVIWEKPG